MESFEHFKSYLYECSKVIDQEGDSQEKISSNPDDKDALRQSQKNLEGPDTVREFKFDGIFRDGTSQTEIFKTAIEPQIQSALNGQNAAIYFRGLDSDLKRTVYNVESQKGFLLKIISNLLDKATVESGRLISIKVQYLRIYLEKIYDMFKVPNQEHVDIKVKASYGQDFTFAQNGSLHSISKIEALLELLKRPRCNMELLNQGASINVFSVFIEQIKYNENGFYHHHQSRLDIVTLPIPLQASKPPGLFQEQPPPLSRPNASVNNVISALVNFQQHNQGHVPYRDSKLTYLMRHTLEFGSSTATIGMLSKQDPNYLTLFRILDRIMKIKRQFNQTKRTYFPEFTKLITFQQCKNGNELNQELKQILVNYQSVSAILSEIERNEFNQIINQ